MPDVDHIQTQPSPVEDIELMTTGDRGELAGACLRYSERREWILLRSHYLIQEC